MCCGENIKLVKYSSQCPVYLSARHVLHCVLLTDSNNKLMNTEPHVCHDGCRISSIRFLTLVSFHLVLYTLLHFCSCCSYFLCCNLVAVRLVC